MIGQDCLFSCSGALCSSCIHKNSCTEYSYESCEGYEPEVNNTREEYWEEMSYRVCRPKSLSQRLREEFIQEELDD